MKMLVKGLYIIVTITVLLSIFPACSKPVQKDVEQAREFNKEDTYYGGTWQLKSTPTYLDFSKDETYVNLNQSALSRKKDLNQAWKASQTGKGFFDSETGEQMPVLPVKTPAKEIVVFKEK